LSGHSAIHDTKQAAVFHRDISRPTSLNNNNARYSKPGICRKVLELSPGDEVANRNLRTVLLVTGHRDAATDLDPNDARTLDALAGEIASRIALYEKNRPLRDFVPPFSAK
jgi:hypothetical protein